MRFTIKDEIYQHRDFSRAKIRVLASLDSTKLDYTKPNIHRDDKDFPVAWAKMYGKGRVFYSTFGHAPETWDDPQIQKMYFEATRWALRLTGDDVTPGKPGNRFTDFLLCDHGAFTRSVFLSGSAPLAGANPRRARYPRRSAATPTNASSSPAKAIINFHMPGSYRSTILRCPGSTGTPMNPGESIAVFCSFPSTYATQLGCQVVRSRTSAGRETSNSAR